MVEEKGRDGLWERQRCGGFFEVGKGPLKVAPAVEASQLQAAGIILNFFFSFTTTRPCRRISPEAQF